MGKTSRVQSIVTNASDSNVPDTMRKHLEDSENHSATRWLDELNHKDVSHSWLWHLTKHRSLVLSSKEFLEAVRIRLGVLGPPKPFLAVAVVLYWIARLPTPLAVPLARALGSTTV